MARQDKDDTLTVSSEISVSSLIGKDDLDDKTTLDRVVEPLQPFHFLLLSKPLHLKEHGIAQVDLPSYIIGNAFDRL